MANDIAKNTSISAMGVTLAPGLASPVAVLSPGKHSITFESAVGENEGLFVRDEHGALLLENGEPIPAESEHLMVKLIYPDGYIKNHQASTSDDLAAKVVYTSTIEHSPGMYASTSDDLAAKVVGVLRGRYGLTGDIKVTSLPKQLAAGAVIEVEV